MFDAVLFGSSVVDGPRVINSAIGFRDQLQ